MGWGVVVFFFQAEDGIRDLTVTGVQTCALPISAEQMRSLPCFFSQIPDPRRTQGRRHRLSTVLGIAAGAVLCGMRGYKAIADGAQSLGQKSRERFGCRREQGHYVVPSESILRNVLIRVTPADLDRALQCWRSEEHTSELQSQSNLVCRLLLEKKKNNTIRTSCDYSC